MKIVDLLKILDIDIDIEAAQTIAPTLHIQNENNLKSFALGEYVILRTCSSGVHYGFLKERCGTEAVITQSRRIHTWKGRFTLSEIARDGLGEGSNVSCAEKEKLLTQIIEVIPIISAPVIQKMTSYPERKI